MSWSRDRHGLYFGNPKKLFEVCIPWNRIFGTDLFRSLSVRVTDSDKIAFVTLAKNPYLILAPEPGPYNAGANAFHVPELPLPIEV
jgi:hypothetical protein